MRVVWIIENKTLRESNIKLINVLQACKLILDTFKTEQSQDGMNEDRMVKVVRRKTFWNKTSEKTEHTRGDSFM